MLSLDGSCAYVRQPLVGFRLGKVFDPKFVSCPAFSENLWFGNTAKPAARFVRMTVAALGCATDEVTALHPNPAWT
jgi:hypothetical protein